MTAELATDEFDGVGLAADDGHGSSVATRSLPAPNTDGETDSGITWPPVEKLELVWFEKSGHEPFMDEPVKFNAAMVELVRPVVSKDERARAA